MIFKIALIFAFVAQLAAAILALRLNLRYRIYSAWFFVSAALSVGAILRLTELLDNWSRPPTADGDWVQWASALAALLSSILLVSGISFIEPFFQKMARAQAKLRSETDRLESIVMETEEELKLAQRIQRNLLPSFVPELPSLDVFGRSDPAVWTSGDYFDFLTLEDGSTAMIVADVSGHGLGPALLMSSTRASFRGLAATTSDVGDLMTSGNRAVVDAVSSNEFVTAMVISYDPQTQSLHYAGAGHVGWVVRSDGSNVMLSAECPPLGIMADMTIQASQQDSLEPGDMIVVVTDGILETENPAGERFGSGALLETVASHREASAEEIVQILLDQAKQFAASKPQQDDITALVVKITE